MGRVCDVTASAGVYGKRNKQSASFSYFILYSYFRPEQVNSESHRTQADGSGF